MDRDTHQQLLSLSEEDPNISLRVDLANQTLILPDGRNVRFPIDGFNKACLLNGVDEIGYVLGMDAKIVAFEVGRL